jgi:threonine synthase
VTKKAISYGDFCYRGYKKIRNQFPTKKNSKEQREETSMSKAMSISSPATGAALVESAERHFGGLDKFDSGTRWPSFTTQGGGR